MSASTRSAFTSALLAVLTFTHFVHAQDVAPNPWVLRARAVTESLAEDAKGLTTLERALLFARVGELWRRGDGQRSREWMVKAVDEIAAADAKDAAAAQRRLEAARSLLSSVGPDDKELSARLMELLAAGAERIGDEDRSANAAALIQAALAALPTDPKRAAELGAASLRAGRALNIIYLVSRMRTRDIKLADALFLSTLERARAAKDKDILLALASVAYNGPSPSDELRAAALGALVEGLLYPPPGSDATTGCAYADRVASHNEQVNRYLPQRVGEIRVALARCQPVLDKWSRQSVGDALGDRQLGTVDELLKAAGGTADLQLRADYYSRAVNLAAQQKDAERAVAILDRMDREVQEHLGETWGNWRWENAATAALARFEAGDRAEADRIVAATPAEVRPHVQLQLADALAHAKNQTDALQLVEAVRAALAKDDVRGKGELGLSLVRHYAALQPTFAPVVLAEAVKELNREWGGGKAPADAFNEALDRRLMPIDLPPALLEVDDTGAQESLASVQSPLKRIRLRLGLLAAVLDKLRDGARAKDDAPANVN